MHPRRIIGIDPGSHRMGLACIEKSGNQLRFVFAETLKAPSQLNFHARVQKIHELLQERLMELRPDEVAIEDIFFAKSVRSAIALGTARGIAIGACLAHKTRIFEYAPTLVKSTVTGDGRADKGQVQKMVQLILGQKFSLGFDATDAIAIAICHASHHRA